MKTSLFRSVPLLVLAVSLSALSPASAGTPREAPLLQDTLKQRSGRSIVLQPLQIKPGQSLVVTHARFGDGSVKKGFARGVQLIVYGTTKDETTGEYPVLHSDTRMVDRSGPQVQTFESYTHPIGKGSQGIIAILIGLLLPANDPDSPRTGLLPRSDSITAEVHDPGTGTALLLPAVQKVREAAR